MPGVPGQNLLFKKITSGIFRGPPKMQYLLYKIFNLCRQIIVF